MIAPTILLALIIVGFVALMIGWASHFLLDRDLGDRWMDISLGMVLFGCGGMLLFILVMVVPQLARA